MIKRILLFLVRKLYSLTNPNIMNNLHISIEDQFKNTVLSRIHEMYKPKCIVIDSVYSDSVLTSLRFNLTFINNYKFSIFMVTNGLYDFEIFLENVDCRDIAVLSTILGEINEGLKAFKPYTKKLMVAHYGNLGLV